MSRRCNGEFVIFFSPDVDSFGAEVNVLSVGGSAIQPVGEEPKYKRENTMVSTLTPEGIGDAFILKEFF